MHYSISIQRFHKIFLGMLQLGNVNFPIMQECLGDVMKPPPNPPLAAFIYFIS
jgi:hypothetical protein